MIKRPSSLVDLSAQLFGIAVGPAAWIVQLVFDYGLSSRACYAGNVPRATQPPSGEHAVLLAVSLTCLAAALTGLWISLAALRRLRGEAGSGRSRFIAMCGVLSASAFAIAISFDLPSTLALSLCWIVAL